METAFLDTNILLENLINKKFQKKFLDLSQNYDIVIYEVVLFELGNLTKKYFGAKIASKIITGLIESYKIYQQNLDDLKQALGIMEKYDFNKPNKDYTLEDCIQLYCVQKEAAIMISLDEEMGFFKFKTGEFLHIQK